MLLTNQKYACRVWLPSKSWGKLAQDLHWLFRFLQQMTKQPQTIHPPATNAARRGVWCLLVGVPHRDAAVALNLRTGASRLPPLSSLQSACALGHCLALLWPVPAICPRSVTELQLLKADAGIAVSVVSLCSSQPCRYHFLVPAVCPRHTPRDCHGATEAQGAAGAADCPETGGGQRRPQVGAAAAACFCPWASCCREGCLQIMLSGFANVRLALATAGCAARQQGS